MEILTGNFSKDLRDDKELDTAEKRAVPGNGLRDRDTAADCLGLQESFSAYITSIQ
jgi:hypothetical protein